MLYDYGSSSMCCELSCAVVGRIAWRASRVIQRCHETCPLTESLTATVIAWPSSVVMDDQHSLVPVIRSPTVTTWLTHACTRPTRRHSTWVAEVLVPRRPRRCRTPSARSAFANVIHLTSVYTRWLAVRHQQRRRRAIAPTWSGHAPLTRSSCPGQQRSGRTRHLLGLRAAAWGLAVRTLSSSICRLV